MKSFTWLGILYIVFMVGWSVTTIDDFPTHCSERFGWTPPIMLLILMGLPLVCGWLGGRGSK